MKNFKMDYKQSGVDIKKGDEASKLLYEAAKKSFENRKGNIGEIIIPFDDFSGVRAIDISKLPENSLMSMGFDGIGTKVEIAQRTNKHDTIAFDLIAMVADDAIVRGAEPVLVGSVLDVNNVDLQAIKQLAEGYVKAAKDANVAIINGELAELGNGVGGYGNFNYNWCSSLIWFANKNKLFTGDEIEVDDSVVVFEEKGFRSNGLSLVRKVFENCYGADWHNEIFEDKTLGEHVLVPSKIYCKAIISMHGGFNTKGNCKINGIAHITGGGLPGKLARILKKKKLGAKLNNLFDPCSAMLHCQNLGKINDEEAYKTWNMGNGLIVITPEPEKVIEEAKKFGISAKLAGKIIKDNIIYIKSQGIEKKDLVFENE
jgi:phosphoribosylformylglycinamidine cyclo-ligase